MSHKKPACLSNSLFLYTHEYMPSSMYIYTYSSSPSPSAWKTYSSIQSHNTTRAAFHFNSRSRLQTRILESKHQQKNTTPRHPPPHPTFGAKKHRSCRRTRSCNDRRNSLCLAPPPALCHTALSHFEQHSGSRAAVIRRAQCWVIFHATPALLHLQLMELSHPPRRRRRRRRRRWQTRRCWKTTSTRLERLSALLLARWKSQRVIEKSAWSHKERTTNA